MHHAYTAAERLDAALEALREIEEAAESIRATIEEAREDADQQIEDGELEASERDDAAWEILDPPAESISLIKGQIQDVEDLL